MNCIARINGEHEYILANYNPSVFNSQMILELVTDDLREIKSLFEDEFFLEIITNNKVIAEYSCFDGYNYISVRSNVFIESLDQFADCLEIKLTKKNLVDQVDEIYRKVNNVVDTGAMSLDKYKEYILNQISKTCEEDIYAGSEVALGNKEVKQFSFKIQDQSDLKALFDLAFEMPECRFPWHSDGEDCKLYLGLDIIRIYSTLQFKLLYLTTYCNGLNQMIRNAESREEIDTYEYGCELIEPYKTNFDIIMNEMITVFNGIKTKFGIDDDDEEPVDNGNDEPSGEPNENPNEEPNEEPSEEPNGESIDPTDEPNVEDPTSDSGENDSGENEPENEPEDDPEVNNE